MTFAAQLILATRSLGSAVPGVGWTTWRAAEEGEGLPWWAWVLIVLILVAVALYLWLRHPPEREKIEAAYSVPGARPSPEAEPAPLCAAEAEEIAPEAAAEAVAEETVEKPTPEPVAAPAPARRDNLKRIEGIGPRISSLLYEAGITSYAQLAETGVDELRHILEKAGLGRLTDPGTWPEQAKLAAADKWAELQALQAELKGGRRV